MRYTQLAVLLVIVWSLSLAGGCSDTPWEQVIRVEDPFASEDERHFAGLVVTFFALTHGESALVRFPNGKTLLVDTGAAEDAPDLLEMLKERRITRLDHVFVTNDQPEQAGGYPYLTEHVQIDTLYLPALTSASMRRLIPERPGQKRVWVSEGDQFTFDTGIVMTVLHPSEPLFLSPQDNSLVVQLKHGRLRVLWTSAINEKAEERLLSRHSGQLQAEVLKVADQGSNQATSQPFLSAVDPQVAIIQTGKSRGEMKAGQEEILERLGESWAETYITGQHGTITILSNGKEYRVLKQRKK